MHCPGDMAVRMCEILADHWLVIVAVTCFSFLSFYFSVASLEGVRQGLFSTSLAFCSKSSKKKGFRPSDICSAMFYSLCLQLKRASSNICEVAKSVGCGGMDFEENEK